MEVNMNDVYQLTEKELRLKKQRLETAKKALEQCQIDMKAARDDGDLSENAAYDAARDKYCNLQSEIAKLTNELDNCEIVHDDNSPIIKIGSVVNVTRLDNNGAPIGETRQFTVAQSGDTIIRKILGAASPLGKSIIGKNSGIFDIVCNGKKRYKVEKVIDE